MLSSATGNSIPHNGFPKLLVFGLSVGVPRVCSASGFPQPFFFLKMRMRKNSQHSRWQHTSPKRTKARSHHERNPVKVSNHIRDRRRVTIGAQVAVETEQGRRECPSSSTGEEGAPTEQPRLSGTNSQRLQGGASLCFCQELEQRLFREATTRFRGNDDESGATSASCELRVCALLAPTGESQGSTILVGTATAWLTIGTKR